MGCLYYIVALPILFAFKLPVIVFKLFIIGIRTVGHVFTIIFFFILELLGILIPNNSTYNHRRFNYQPQSLNIELNKIDNLDGLDFELYVASLLKKIDYYNVIVNPASGDYGIDIVATKNNQKYGFQCKRYKSSVGNAAVQEVVAGLPHYRCVKGVVVTNSYFTKNAKNLAASNNVELWDRDKLSILIKMAIK